MLMETTEGYIIHFLITICLRYTIAPVNADVDFPSTAVHFAVKQSIPRGSIKGKAVPLQAWSGPEGSRKLRFPDLMTTQDSGKVVSLTHRPHLPPGNTPGTHFC